MKTSSPKRPGVCRRQSEYGAETALRASVSHLLTAKARPFTVTGHIPMDPVSLMLFFCSKSGITHSLDFPINIDYDTLLALEVLLAACKPHPTPGFDVYPDCETLFYPSNLPLIATLEITNHPILDAVRNALFPTEACMAPKSHTLRNDGNWNLSDTLWDADGLVIGSSVLTIYSACNVHELRGNNIQDCTLPYLPMEKRSSVNLARTLGRASSSLRS
ncbi:hypothetical protein EV424DRAFT_1531607 [Suillus variegatus]|nr:hypothetical protein EV424DRAFT_1531607 [Suillus variegatus]